MLEPISEVAAQKQPFPKNLNISQETPFLKVKFENSLL